MAYNGYLFQWGDFIFPLEHIKWDSYDSAPGQYRKSAGRNLNVPGDPRSRSDGLTAL